MARRVNSGTALVNAVVQYLNLNQKRRKYCYWRNNSGALPTARGGFMRFGTPGSPDIVVIKDGFFIGLECKAGSGRLSPIQKEFHDMIKTNGGECYVIRSIDDLIQIGL